MRRKTKKLLYILFAGILCGIAGICFFAWIFVGMFMSVTPNQVNHYKDDNNYYEIECKVIETNYGYKDNYGKAIAVIEGNEYDSRYDRIGLWDTNADVVEKSGFWEDIDADDIVYVITTDGYFWDGYTRPIAKLRTESKVYLDFETGKANQVEELESMRIRYLHWTIPLLSTMAFSGISGIILFIVFGRWIASTKKANAQNLKY